MPRSCAMPKIAARSWLSRGQAVEQSDVDGGQPADAVQRVGARSAAETGVAGRDRPHVLGLGEQIGEGGDRLRPGAAVEDHERTALATLGKGEVNRSDSVHGDVLGRRVSHAYSGQYRR